MSSNRLGPQSNASSVLAQLNNLSAQEQEALVSLLGLHNDTNTIDEIEAALTLLALSNNGVPTVPAPPLPTARPSTPSARAASLAAGTMGLSPTSTITASPASSNPSPRISLAEYRAWKESGIKSYAEYVASKRA